MSNSSEKNTFANSPDASGSARAWFDLRNACWLSIFIHALAGLSLIAILSHGLQTNDDLKNRIDFLAHNTAIWIIGWLTWNAAALSILYFFLCFNRASRSEAKNNHNLLKLSVFLVAAAIAIDLSAEAIEMLILPDLAHRITTNVWNESSQAVQQFLSMSRLAVGLTGYLANGLYTIATILACWSTRNLYPKVTIFLGSMVGISGLALSYFSLVDSTSGLYWSNVVLVPCILFWQTGIAIVAGMRSYRKLA